MPDSTHALLSPSSSHIWLECTPAARFAAQFPNETTEYAKEGTEAHALAEYKLRIALGETAEDPRENMAYLTAEMEECTDDYVSYILETLSRLKETCPDPSVFVEQKLDFSRYVPEGFGYGDCIIVSDGRLIIIDLKYGLGVEVKAEWNSQFLMYALGAIELLSPLYEIKDITVTAFQPRRANISSFDITLPELEKWKDEVLVPRAKLAYEGEGVFKAGEHCRFCRARFTCRERAQHNLKLCAYDFKKPEELTLEEIPEILGRIRELEAWTKDVEDYALRLAIGGTRINGWKLVEGRSVRKYTDENEVASVISSLGYDPWEKTLKGITAMEKMVGKKIFNEKVGSLLYKAPGKPTLAPLSDKREEIEFASADFRESSDAAKNTN